MGQNRWPRKITLARAFGLLAQERPSSASALPSFCSSPPPWLAPAGMLILPFHTHTITYFMMITDSPFETSCNKLKSLFHYLIPLMIITISFIFSYSNTHIYVQVASTRSFMAGVLLPQSSCARGSICVVHSGASKYTSYSFHPLHPHTFREPPLHTTYARSYHNKAILFERNNDQSIHIKLPNARPQSKE